MQGMHQLTRDADGGERETIFRVIAEDVQSKVGAPEFITSSLRVSSNISHRDKTEQLTYEGFYGLLFKLPPRIPPQGEELSHPLELGS